MIPAVPVMEGERDGKGERLQFRQEKMEGGQHGGQQTELDQDHQPAGLAEGGKTAAGTPAHGAGLVPHLTEGRAFLFRKGDGRGVEGRPQRSSSRSGDDGRREALRVAFAGPGALRGRSRPSHALPFMEVLC